MRECFHPGLPVVVASDSPVEPYSTIFEDDGETAYFHAYDRRPLAEQILDAVHIYNVSAVVDHSLESVVEIIWSDDGLKSALLINDYPHAVFDFTTKRGYCRTNFPNFQRTDEGGGMKDSHEWDEAVMEHFCMAE